MAWRNSRLNHGSCNLVACFALNTWSASSTTAAQPLFVCQSLCEVCACVFVYLFIYSLVWLLACLIAECLYVCLAVCLSLCLLATVSAPSAFIRKPTTSHSVYPKVAGSGDHIKEAVSPVIGWPLWDQGRPRPRPPQQTGLTQTPSLIFVRRRKRGVG